MYSRIALYLSLVLASIAITNESNCFGQALYSYLDEDGVRVFTNMPPVGTARDVKITGAIASVQPPDNSSMKADSRYSALIDKYAEQYQLDPSLIRSVIATESGFDPRAVSPKGARGLMQLMPATAARLGVKNIFDPEQNIRGGTKHLRSLLDTFSNDLILSLAAYNAGENLVQRLGRVPEIKETRDYVGAITRRYGRAGIAEQPIETARIPSTFRFVDETGVLHLTNIPPVGRSYSESHSWLDSGQTP